MLRMIRSFELTHSPSARRSYHRPLALTQRQPTTIYQYRSHLLLLIPLSAPEPLATPAAGSTGLISIVPDTQHGVFASVLQLTTLSSPIDFNDRTRGQWYKVKGQTCDETTIGQPIWTCGNWSDWSSTIELPLQLTPTPVPPYLWPDPSTVTFQADGTWHEFTRNFQHKPKSEGRCQPQSLQPASRD